MSARTANAIAVLVFLAILILWSTAPLDLPANATFATLEGRATGEAVRECAVRFPKDREDVTLLSDVDLSRGKIRVEFSCDGTGAFCSLTYKGAIREKFPIGFMGGLKASETYRLRVKEEDAQGEYSIRAVEAPPSKVWPRQLALMVVLGAVASADAVWRRSGHAGLPRAWRRLIQGFVLYILLIALYALVHEAGHLLAASAFGVAHWSFWDALGLSGSPVAKLDPNSANVLTPLQQGLIGLGGPVSPTLLGWVMLGAWNSRRGRVRRAGSVTTDVIWTAATLVMLLGQVGLLAPVLGFEPGSDYTRIVENGLIPRLACDALLVTLAVINLCFVAVLIRHLRRLARGHAPAAA